MGDFAAGKLLLNGVEIAPVVAEDFDQFVTDMDNFEEFITSVAEVPPGAATEDDLALLAEAVMPQTASEMLLCLKQWRDHGVALFVNGTSYTVQPAMDIRANFDARPADAYVIGADIEGDPLQMAQSTGELFDGQGNSLGLDLAQALGMLRHFAIAKQIEWAEGWVEKA